MGFVWPALDCDIPKSLLPEDYSPLLTEINRPAFTVGCPNKRRSGAVYQVSLMLFSLKMWAEVDFKFLKENDEGD